jgi:hypothetical protein
MVSSRLIRCVPEAHLKWELPLLLLNVQQIQQVMMGLIETTLHQSKQADFSDASIGRSDISHENFGNSLGIYYQNIRGLRDQANWILWQCVHLKFWHNLSVGDMAQRPSQSQRQSQSHITTDGQSVCLSWCRAPSRDHDQIFVECLTVIVSFMEGCLSDDMVGLFCVWVSQQS